MGNSTPPPAERIDLSRYENIINLKYGNKKVYLHNRHTCYCCAFCKNPNCNHGPLGTRWPGDEYYCITDKDGYIIRRCNDK